MPEPKTISKPDPDPTIMTTSQLMKVTQDLKELIFTRLDAMDKAMSLFNDNITRVPTDVDKQVARLKELIEAKMLTLDPRFLVLEEKFHSVHTQFVERDIRVEQTARDSKVAVDAALQAAKEAVGEQNKSSGLSIAKSETATIKMIDSQSVLINTSTAAINDKIEDLKERVLRYEASIVGQNSNRTEQRAQNMSTSQIIGVAAAVIFGVISLMISIFWHTGAQK